MKHGHTQPVWLFAHGWSYDHTFFTPLLQELSNTATLDTLRPLCVALDRGHRSPTGQTRLMIFDREGWAEHPTETLHSLVLSHAFNPWIGIGHSMGFAQLLKMPIRWQRLISLHGFTHFCPQPNRPEGTPTRIVQRMLTALQTRPRQTVTEFQMRTGWLQTDLPTWPHPLPTNHPLYNELHELMHLNICPQTHADRPILALESILDPIVPHSLSLNCERHRQPNLPHSGPASIPTRYTQALELFLNYGTTHRTPSLGRP